MNLLCESANRFALESTSDAAARIRDDLQPLIAKTRIALAEAHL